jgi:hypothetical protein
MKVILMLFLNLLFIQPSYAQERVKVRAVQVDSSFDNASLARLQEAVKVLDSIYNSEEFAQAVLRTSFKAGNHDLDSKQILELIRSGADNYKNKPKDYSIDIRVKLFDEYFGHGNFGITDMGTGITRTHRCYILHNDIKCYISHLAHEYMHQIGFYDERTWFGGTKTKSVPYKIGNIIDKLTGNTAPCLAKDETCTK